jgi:lysylphosphatidylglycerol synthetase-like protein (DUF2156 family)
MSPNQLTLATGKPAPGEHRWGSEIVMTGQTDSAKRGRTILVVLASSAVVSVLVSYFMEGNQRTGFLERLRVTFLDPCMMVWLLILGTPLIFAPVFALAMALLGFGLTRKSRACFTTSVVLLGLAWIVLSWFTWALEFG